MKNRMDSRECTNVPRQTKYQQEQRQFHFERICETIAIVGSALAFIGFLIVAFFAGR